MKWKIRDVEIDNPIVVAPMAGVTNAPFRTVAKEFGAGLVVCEMISDRALLYQNEKTLNMLTIGPNEYPLSIQIMGGEIDSMVQAAEYIQEHTSAAIIDINMGCPVPKVTNNDSGSSWLLQPDKIYDLVKAMRSHIDLPVTVKMRMGWDDDSIFAVENAQAAEAAGADMVAMHGRTRLQMYEGQANWEILKEVKNSISIPFVGNGDVRTPQDAKRMLEEVGADAVMVGRAALGHPWVVHQMNHYLETGEILDEPTPTEKIETAVVHLGRLVDMKGEVTAAKEFRKHASYYLKGFPGAAKVKQAINETENPEEQVVAMREAAVQAEEKLRDKEARRKKRRAKKAAE